MVSLEEQLTISLKYAGPKKTFDSFIGVNNAKIPSRNLDNGLILANERTLIYDFIIRSWIGDFVQSQGYSRPIALVALGGYGRGEMVPNSDADLSLLIDDVTSAENKFVDQFEQRVSDFYEKIAPFHLKVAIHNLDDVRDPGKFDVKVLSSYMDMRPIYNPIEIDFASVFREDISKHYDRVSLFRHNLELWEEIARKWPQKPHELESFHIKEGIGGVRHLHAGLRMLGINDFASCITLYEKISEEWPELTGWLGFLLKTRSWLNLYKGEQIREKKTKEKKEDLSEIEVLRYPDFVELGREFGEEAKERLIFTRRAISNFAEGILHKMQEEGFKCGKFIYGPNSVRLASPPLKKSVFSASKKDKELLANDFFALLKESQRRGIEISPAVYTNDLPRPEEWVAPHSGFVELFYTEGKLSKTIETLTRLNVLNTLLPGFSQLETSIPSHGHRGHFLTRTAFARKKLETLEELLAKEQMDLDTRAGIQLAILLKHIPEVRNISSEQYLLELKSEYPTFSQRTLDLTELIIENKGLMLDAAKKRVCSDDVVKGVVDTCKSLENLIALYLFTKADYTPKYDASVDREILEDMKELFKKAKSFFVKDEEEEKLLELFIDTEKLELRGLDGTGAGIVASFGPELTRSRYMKRLPEFAEPLRKAHESGEPTMRISRISSEETADQRPRYQLGIASPDYPGLIAVISGACFKADLDIRRVYAYTNPKYSVVLDFFEVAAEKNIEDPAMLKKSIENSIKDKTFITEYPKTILSPLNKKVTLEDLTSSSGLLRLSFQTDKNEKGVLYALARTLYEKLKANIYGVKASVENDSIINSIFFKTPFAFEEANNLVREHIG
jgi:UTP:GlnB (protein PII) uridylyltransferase